MAEQQKQTETMASTLADTVKHYLTGIPDEGPRAEALGAEIGIFDKWWNTIGTDGGGRWFSL